eukprot:13169436-Alexandrium_andersonii.AAC.1
MGQAPPGSPSPGTLASKRPHAATQSAASWAEAAVSGRARARSSQKCGPPSARSPTADQARAALANLSRDGRT